VLGFLNDIASKLGNNGEVKGSIVLYTDRLPCDSRSNVIRQFKARYKNIEIEVLHNNDEILR
jgi:hypothetical protein